MQRKKSTLVMSFSKTLFAGWLMCIPIAPSFAQTIDTECPENPEKSGTFTLDGQKRGLFVAFRWGEGIHTLNNGQEFEFSVRGLKFGETGSSTLQIMGDVYGLNNLHDFVGYYEGTAGGFLPLIDKKDVQLVNANCVTLVARVVESGLHYSLEAGQSFFVEFTND